MSAVPHNSISNVIKRVLDVVRILAFASLILWPLFVIVMSAGQHSDPESWGVDIDVFAHFVIDLNEFALNSSESAGVRDPVISGKAALGIDTSSLYALYLFTALLEVGGIIGLLLVLQLRTLFASLASGSYFSAENSDRIKKIGFIIIGWTLITPLLQYFGGRAILAEYSLSAAGIRLHPAFEVNGAGIFTGLALLVLSGILVEATSIHQERQLTI